MMEKLTNLLEEMSESELLTIHNNYCDSANGYDNYIYNMDDLNELLDGKSPEEIARLIFYGDFNPNHDYFTFNGYGNLESITGYNLTDYIFISDIVDYIISRDDDLYNDDIRDILDNIEEDGKQ